MVRVGCFPRADANGIAVPPIAGKSLIARQDIARTTESVWRGLAGIVGLLWVAAAFVSGKHVVWRGNHPETLHSLVAAGVLFVFWGTPITALLLTGIFLTASAKQEPIPAIARRALIFVWGLQGLILLAMVSLMAYGWLTRGR